MEAQSLKPCYCRRPAALIKNKKAQSKPKGVFARHDHLIHSKILKTRGCSGTSPVKISKEMLTNRGLSHLCSEAIS